MVVGLLAASLIIKMDLVTSEARDCRHCYTAKPVMQGAGSHCALHTCNDHARECCDDVLLQPATQRSGSKCWVIALAHCQVQSLIGHSLHITKWKPWHPVSDGFGPSFSGHWLWGFHTGLNSGSTNITRALKPNAY